MSTLLPGKLQRSKSVYQSVSHFIPAGHEKSLKQALYTTLSLVLLVVVICVVVCAYFVLQIFIKPLLWAVLCGSFLFPFKYALQSAIAKWLTHTWDRGIPLAVGAAVLPLMVFSNFSDWLGTFIVRKWKIISSFILGMVCLYFLNYVGLLTWVIFASGKVITLCWIIIYYVTLFTTQYSGLVLIFLAVYFFSALFLNCHISPYMSITVWLFGLFYLTGVLQIPIVIFLFILFGFGLLYSDNENDSNTKLSNNSQQEGDGDETNGDESCSNSALYFNCLFFIFAVVVTWLHIWILLLLLIPLTFWLCKNAFFHSKTTDLINAFCIKSFKKNRKELLREVVVFWNHYKPALFPEPLPKILLTLRKGDRFLHKCIISYLPTVTSILIIVLLFTNAIFMSVFVIAKVQQEGFLVLKISSDLINETVSQYPEYKSWLPDNETMQKSMDSVVDILYVKGREWLQQHIHSTMGAGVNNTKVENQVLKLWDDFYEVSFTQKAHVNLKRDSTQNENSGIFHSIIDLLNMSEVLSWLQENISALMTVGETILFMVQSNVTLLMSIFTAIFTTLLAGGTLVLNFLISMVIFFTALFYLLSSSKNHYKPLEVLGSAIQPLAKGTHVENAIEDAVNGVFGASVKMFCFYGLYTWVNHCIFGSNVVYISSILTAIFAVIPVLTTYWISLPAALEVWLVQGSLLRAIGLVICQILPTLIVDAAIYYDMSKNGSGVHPYVTGLAVAGGFYTIGLEGAVAGPLILCLLLVAANLYSNATKVDAEEIDVTAEENEVDAEEKNNL